MHAVDMYLLDADMCPRSQNGKATQVARRRNEEYLMSPADQATGEAPAQSVRLVIAAVAVTLLLSSLGQTIVSAALPVIVGQLGGLEHLTWVVIAYLLSSTVVAPIYGKLGDLYGRKIVLQVAIL